MAIRLNIVFKFQTKTLPMPAEITTKSKLSTLLSAIHTHAEIANEENTDQIVYRERDIIELLKKIKEDENILKDGLVS